MTDTERLQGIGNTEEPSQISHWFPSLASFLNPMTKIQNLTLFFLFYVNLINYMDRSIIAGMMDYIEKDEDFKLQNNNALLGLLQTVFVIAYMIFAPLFGYLGDRYSRKLILGIGIVFWSLSTLIGSFMYNFTWFLFFRALVGIGEASYSTVAPSIISDIFSKDSRSRALTLFYFAIPLGTGFGYMLGSKIGGSASDWRSGLRITPLLGLLALIFIFFCMMDPSRGGIEGSSSLLPPPKSPLEDIRALKRNKSFVLLTGGFTCVAFSVGALFWWGPHFAYQGAKVACGNKVGCEKISLSLVSFRFGIIMTLAGLFGVPLGSYVSQCLRNKFRNADALVCAVTLMFSSPIMFLGLVSARYSIETCYALTFFVGLFLNCNWAIVSDITLYIVIPTRRSFASATQILFSHMLGDAVSPYLIGGISDSIRPIFIGSIFENMEFTSLQYALFICCFIQLLGSLFFFLLSFTVVKDKEEADRNIAFNQIYPFDDNNIDNDEN